MARCTGDQLVLADARRSAASTDRRYGAGVSRNSSAMCTLPSSSLRALGAGRLFWTGGFLHAFGSQEFWSASALLFVSPRHDGREEPADRSIARAKIPGWRNRQVHA